MLQANADLGPTAAMTRAFAAACRDLGRVMAGWRRTVARLVAADAPLADPCQAPN